MNIVVFGSFGKRVLPKGWTKETTIALLGSADFDLTGVEPGDNPRLTAAAILGSDFERGDRILAVGDSEGICFKPLEGSVEAAE